MLGAVFTFKEVVPGAAIVTDYSDYDMCSDYGLLCVRQYLGSSRRSDVVKYMD